MDINKEDNSRICAEKICEHLSSELGFDISDFTGDLIQDIIINYAYEAE